MPHATRGLCTRPPYPAHIRDAGLNWGSGDLALEEDARAAEREEEELVLALGGLKPLLRQLHGVDRVFVLLGRLVDFLGREERARLGL